MAVKLEHANLVVKDVDGIVRFLQHAFPEFVVRHEGKNSQGQRWLHVGTSDTYLALQEATVEPREPWRPYSGLPGVNHLGYEVDDVAKLVERMTAGGYENSTVPNAHPHRKRAYFHDPDGNDWEFVQYLSDHEADRNDYKLGEIW